MGGYRVGAGRPKGSRTLALIPATTPARPDMTPLEYMLAVMRDPLADPARRDRMAIAAAPFLHRKVADIGKKEAADLAALDAGKGSRWAELLDEPEADPVDDRAALWDELLR